MSNTIDERVVEMQFDNKQFEANVETSLGTLDKLKKALKLDGAAGAFSGISKAAEEVSLSPVERGIASLEKRFSHFGTFSARILENLADSVYNLGSKMVHSITDTIVGKGISRAKNIEQAKFQLKGLGVEWDRISGDIDYAVNGTAYGLDEAAKVASQLVASNVEIGDSMKQALRGISGVAAMTNSEYGDIGGIFTTVAGNGRLMGDQLQQLSARGLNVAAALGKYLGKSEEQIRKLVSKGKIDFATFAAAMDETFGDHATAANETFTGALANMKAALGRIGAEVAIPMLENLRNLFNSLRVIFNGVHKAIMPMINAFNDLARNVFKHLVAKLDSVGKAFGDVAHGGRIVTITMIFKNLTTVISNLARGIWSFVSPIIKALSSLIPPITLNGVNRFTRTLADLTSNFGLSEAASKGFTKVLTILLSPLKLIWNIFGFIGKVIGVVVKGFSLLGEAISFVIGEAGRFGADVKRNMESRGWSLQNMFSRLGEIIGKVGKAIRSFVQSAKSEFSKIRALPGVQKLLDQLRSIREALVNIGGSILAWLAEKIHSISGIDIKFPGFDGLAGIIDFVASKLADFLSLLRTGAGRIGDFFKMVGEKVGGGLSVVGQYIGKGVEGLKAFFKNLKFPKLDKDFFKNFKERFSGIGEVLASIKKPLSDFFGSLGGVGGSLGEKWQKVKQVFADIFSDPSSPFLVTNAVNTGVLATLAVGLKNFLNGIGEFAKSAGSFMSGINSSLKELGKTLKTYQKDLKADILKKIAVAIIALAGAVYILSKVDADRLWQSVGALGALLAILSVVMIALDKMSSTSKTDKGFFFKGFKDWGFNKSSESKTVLDAVKAMIAIAASVLILAIAVKKIAEIGDMKKAGISLAILAGIMAALVGSFVLIGTLEKKEKIDLSSIKSAAIGMVGMALAVSIIAKAMAGIGNLKPQQYEQGLWAIIAIMGMMAAFAYAVGQNGKSVLAGAVGTMALAAAIMMLIPPLVILGLIPTNLLLKGGLAVAAAMTALALAARIAGKGSFGGAASFIAIALALNMLIVPIMAFAFLPAAKLWKSVGAIAAMAGAIGLVSKFLLNKSSLKGAASFAIMAGSLTLLAGAIAVLALLPWQGLAAAGIVLGGLMLALAFAGKIAVGTSDAILDLGAAMFLFGAGILLVAKSMVPFATGIVALAGSFALLGEIGPAAVKGLFVVIEEFINQMILLLPRVAGMLVNAVGVLIWSICAAIGSNAVQIVHTVLMVLIAIMDAIADHIQDFTILAIKIIVEFIRGIAEMLPDVIDAGIKLMVAFVNGMANGIRSSESDILEAVKNIVSAVIEFVIAAIQEILRMIPKFGDDLADQLEGAKNKVRETLAPESFNETGAEIPQETASGIRSHIPEVAEASSEMATAAGNPMDDILQKYSMIGTDSPQSLIDGLLSGEPGVYDASSRLAQGASIPMDQVVYAFEHDGKLAPSGMADGMLSGYPDVLNASQLLGDASTSGLTDSQAGAIGSDLGGDFATRMMEQSGKAKEAGHKIGTAALDGLRDSETDVTNRGNIIGDKYAEGVSAKAKKAQEAGKSLGTNTTLGLSNIESKMYEIGNNAGAGFHRGFKGWEPKLKQLSQNYMKLIDETLRKAGEIRSPSRMTRRIGEYLGEGLAVGLDRSANAVEHASEGVANTAINSMQDAVSMVLLALSSIDEMRPVIQPVFDLSELKAQAGYVNSMLGNQQVSFGARANFNNLDQLMNLASQINQNGSSNADVVNAITDLRRDVNALGGQMERMQVRMDTGALVGAIYNPLDKELGRQVRYRTRGA